MNHSRIIVLTLTLAGLCACQPKTASLGGGPTDTSPPVATVNGEPITRDFYDFYIKGITNGKSPSDLTAQQRSMALDNLIRARLVGDQAMKEGLDKTGDTPNLLQIARLNVLEQAVQEHYLKDRKPTDEELRAEYQQVLASMPKTEYHARHILVDSESTAQQVIARLDKGEKFDDLAKLVSKDSSKNNGGDLGWVTPNRMVPEFSGALLALKPGEYTKKPVQSQYGWHVIQLLDTREVSPPPYEQVRQRLEQVVQQKKFREYTDELLHNAKVERFIDQPTTGPAPGAPATTPPAGAMAPSGSASPASPPPPKN
jgi:peptidyl-prolyl cis-trans isomerase C